MIQRLTAVSSNDVKKIPLLRYLPKRVLEYVLSETHVEHQNAGVGIVANGEGTDRVYFLLQGEVELISADGTRRHLQSDQPISPLLAENSPNDAAINSLTAVDLLTLPRELYNAIKGLPPVANARSNQTIELNDAEGPEDSLYWEFYEAIKNDTLELPSMPDITLRIAKVINDSNTDSEEIARVVQADPTVAARIISVVNSAAYRGKQQIETLPDAVTRLGRSVTHNLVISFALGKLFNSRSKVLKRRMIDLWKHVSYVAPICHELAQVNPRAGKRPGPVVRPVARYRRPRHPRRRHQQTRVGGKPGTARSHHREPEGRGGGHGPAQVGVPRLLRPGGAACRGLDGGHQP